MTDSKQYNNQDTDLQTIEVGDTGNAKRVKNIFSLILLILIGVSVLLLVFVPVFSQGIDYPKDDEVVICFTTAAYYSKSVNAWLVPISGRIFEPEQDDILRNMFISAIKKAGDFDQGDQANKLFKARVQDFIADNERGKRLEAKFDKISYRLENTDKDGLFNSVMKLTDGQITGFENNGWINYSIQTRENDNRVFSGSIHVVSPGSVCVISDIDDTVKVTGVTDKSQMMKNVFSRPYKATDGMVDYYKQMEKEGYNFFYVSASPMQLYRPLAEWMFEVGYPAGPIRLRDFYIADTRAFNMLKESGKVKQPVIEEIISRYPACTFILIGDAGEQDAAIYGQIARKYPEHISKIQIRALSEPDKVEVERICEMMGELPAICQFDILWQGKAVKL